MMSATHYTSQQRRHTACVLHRKRIMQVDQETSHAINDAESASDRAANDKLAATNVHVTVSVGVT